MGKLIIEKASIHDVDKLHQFFELVIEHTFVKEGLADLQEEINSEIQVKKQFIQEAIGSNHQKRLFLVGKVNDQVVGTIAYGPVGDLIIEGTKGMYATIGEIGSVYVLPDYQNQGIGRQLLKRMLNILQDLNVTEFCLDSGFKTAVQVWSKILGEPSIVMKDYWEEGSNHYIWHQKIKEGELI